MSASIFIGIDPGRSGAIAAITPDLKVLMLKDWPDLSTKKNITSKKTKKKKTKIIHNIPAEISEVCSLWKDLFSRWPEGESIIAIEKQHGFTFRSGKKENDKRAVGVVSTVILMQTYTAWLTLVISRNHIPRLVSAQEWQKEMLGKKRGVEMDTKKESLERARKLFPSANLRYKYHHGRSDALLIAYWLLCKIQDLDIQDKYHRFLAGEVTLEDLKAED